VGGTGGRKSIPSGGSRGVLLLDVSLCLRVEKE